MDYVFPLFTFFNLLSVSCAWYCNPQQYLITLSVSLSEFCSLKKISSTSDRWCPPVGRKRLQGVGNNGRQWHCIASKWREIIFSSLLSEYPITVSSNMSSFFFIYRTCFRPPKQSSSAMQNFLLQAYSPFTVFIFQTVSSSHPLKKSSGTKGNLALIMNPSTDIQFISHELQIVFCKEK